MTADPSKTKFSTSIIAITGLIGAVAGLLTVMHTTGVIHLTNDTKEKRTEKEVVVNTRGTNDQQENTEKTHIVPVVNKKEEQLVERIPEKTRTHNISGYWYENQSGSRYFFNQDVNGNVYFQEYSINEYGMAFVSAEGTGVLTNNQFRIPFMHYTGYEGIVNGTIDTNGNTIDAMATFIATGQSTRVLIHRE